MRVGNDELNERLCAGVGMRAQGRDAVVGGRDAARPGRKRRCPLSMTLEAHLQCRRAQSRGLRYRRQKAADRLWDSDS